MVIAIGYRVNSRRGTEFRIWATSILRDPILKGYTLNEKRLTVKGDEHAHHGYPRHRTGRNQPVR